MYVFDLKMRIHAALPMSVLAVLLAHPACSGKRQPTGSAKLAVRTMDAIDLDSMAVTVSGPAMPAPKSYALSPGENAGTWEGGVGPIPIGGDYLFEVAGQSKTSAGSTHVASVSGIVIATDGVPTVLVNAPRARVRLASENSAPIIDSLVVSSSTVLPNAAITLVATAHDSDPADTLEFSWTVHPAEDGFSAPSSTTTNWTAPSTASDQTLLLTVIDNHGGVASVSIVVHVTTSPDVGTADVTVTLNDWPIVTNLLANPGTIALGSPTALAVMASDGDGDILAYAWSSSCTSGVFSTTTAPTTKFALPVGDTHTRCDFIVTVSDGRGGATTGRTTLPVGMPPVIEAPTIIQSVQSDRAVDANGRVTLTVSASDPQGSPLSFQWVSPAGTFSNQVDESDASHIVWTAPAATGGDVTVSAIVTDALGASVKYDFSVSTPGSAPVAVPIPRFASWLLAVALATLGTMVLGRQRRQA